MTVKDKAKLKEAIELLDEAQGLINDALTIEDSELGGSLDHYNTIGDIVSDLEEKTT